MFKWTGVDQKEFDYIKHVMAYDAILLYLD